MIAKQIRAEARSYLQNRWDKAIVAFLIYYGIDLAITWLTHEHNWILLIISGPFMYGIAKYYLEMFREDKIDLNSIFSAFRFSGGNLGLFGKTAGTYLLMLLYIFLWGLLFVIPGIIAAYSYRMVFLILYDNPEIGITEALRRSKELMHGYKADLFLLDLSFLGWIFLSIISFGIGFIWLLPYMFASQIVFYEKIKNSRDQTKENRIYREERDLSGVIE